MGIIKYVDFDYYLNRVKASETGVLLARVAKEIAPHSSVSPALMNEILAQRESAGGISLENGIAMFDLTTRFITKPITLIASLEPEIDLEAPDNRPVDLFIAVISPANNVSAHLQRLSSVARLFRSKELCKALRSASSVDEMKVLFMPTQDWMVAA